MYIQMQHSFTLLELKLSYDPNVRLSSVGWSVGRSVGWSICCVGAFVHITYINIIYIYTYIAYIYIYIYIYIV